MGGPNGNSPNGNFLVIAAKRFIRLTTSNIPKNGRNSLHSQFGRQH